jgi:hypothetical protein
LSTPNQLFELMLGIVLHGVVPSREDRPGDVGALMCWAATECRPFLW